jgi:hypothetical protein
MTKALAIGPSDRVHDTRLPLVVGIAADRGLTAEAAQRAEEPVARILAGMCGLYRATPFLLLVQLPEALRRSAEQLAATLDADVVDLEEHFAPALVPPGGAGATDPRSGACEDVTRRATFLADQCHLVIVISDSRGTAPGGLADQIIQFRLQGIPDRHKGRPLQLDSVGLGSVHHVVAGTSGEAAVADASASTFLRPQIETAFGSEELDDAAAWDHLERFNADVAKQWQRGPRAAISPPQGQPLTALSGQAWIGDRFAVADALAVRFQRATHATMLALLVLGLAAALAFQLSGVFSHSPPIYTACLALAYGCYLWAYWQRYEHRFHDYRALAEGLRVQMHWSAAGITARASDYYLRRQRSELDWIRQALRAWTLTARTAPTASAPSDLARRAPGQVLEEWVDDQWNYYSQAARRRQAMGTWLNRVAKGFFLLGLLLAGTRPLFHGNVAFNVAIGLAPVVAALLYVYTHTRAFLEQARQYDRMSSLFGNARRRLRQALAEGDLETFRGLLLDLGKEALRENGDWVLLHRERPISFGEARSWIQAGSWILGVCSRRRKGKGHSQPQ